MKKLTIFFLLFVSFGCSRESAEKEIALDGIWKWGENYFLVTDSLMTHPYYNVAGFFKYRVNGDSLAVFEKEVIPLGEDISLKIIGFDEEKLTLTFEGDTLKYHKVASVPSVNRIKKLFFKAGHCDGTCPVFQFTLDNTGKLIYEGKAYTTVEGVKEYQLDTALVAQINQLFHHVDIEGYPQDELSPPPGSSHQTLMIEFMDGKEISIVHGQFGGKYNSIIQVFGFIETLLNKVKTPPNPIKKQTPAGQSENALEN